MLRNCVCIGRGNSNRKNSSASFESSCRSSEIERSVVQNGSAAGTSTLLQIFHSKTWYRHWRKSGRSYSMTKAEKTIKSALLIQRWYRRYMARIEIRRRYTWTIFQNLEYAGEQDQVELYNFFNALLVHMPVAVAGKHTATSRRSSDTKLSDDSDKEDSATDKVYTGPHIAMPLTKKDIDILIDLFRRKKDNNLHAKYVGLILREAATQLKRLPNFNSVSMAISKQVTIIGDLHGKLDDLLVLLHKNGLPSTENPYIFNGDFVDRGKKGIEVFILLLALFLAFPGSVLLNRGNHEDSVMNFRYGFIREVQQKYPRNSDKLLRLIDEVYRWLPLGSLVNNRVFIVHGGISDTTDLDLLKRLDRGKYVSILRPPVEATGSEAIDKTEWKQLFDIMWSDPQHNEGCQPNSLRGAGSYFGPDVTDNFLSKYKLKYLVRSHECKAEGYEFAHEEKVITIFSASNYYAIGSNKGAYLKLTPQLEPYFVQYISAASKTRELTFRQKVGLVESSALRELGARLRDRRSELEIEFRQHDSDGNGFISTTKWCASMEKVTKLGLPWRLMRDKLAPSAEDAPLNEINYLSTLELLDTDIITEAHEQATSVTDALYKNKSSLEAIFHIIDTDNSGLITLDEFGAACDLLAKYLPTTNRDHLLEMCKMMDINKDGFVDLNEFLEAFRLCDQSRKGSTRGLTPNRTVSSTPQSSHRTHERQNTLKVAAVAATLSRSMPEAEHDLDPTDHVSSTSTPKAK